jgi:hypothetical protein
MDHNDYADRAIYCLEMATKAPDDDIRSSWQLLADLWFRMAATESPVFTAPPSIGTSARPE